jgi:hypothetical protein
LSLGDCGYVTKAVRCSTGASIVPRQFGGPQWQGHHAQECEVGIGASHMTFERGAVERDWDEIVFVVGPQSAVSSPGPKLASGR